MNMVSYEAICKDLEAHIQRGFQKPEEAPVIRVIFEDQLLGRSARDDMIDTALCSSPR